MRHHPRTRQATRTLTLIAATAALTGLAACSSGSNATNPTDGTSASPSVIAGEVGGDPGTWTPLQVSIKMKNITVDMRVGQVAQFVEFPASPDGYTVVSADENIAKATSSTDADAAFGFVATGMGQTEVRVYAGSDTDTDPVYVVKVNVPNLNPAPPVPASPAAEDTPAE